MGEAGGNKRHDQEQALGAALRFLSGLLATIQEDSYFVFVTLTIDKSSEHLSAKCKFIID